MRSRRVSGFTLVELLVVIGIVALLIAIMLPAISRARASSMLLKCSTNVRAIAQAANAYASDNHGLIPRDFGEGGRLFAVLFSPYLGGPWVPADFFGDLGAGVNDRGEIDRVNGHGTYESLVVFQAVKVYQCPSVERSSWYAYLHYAINSVDFEAYRATGRYAPPTKDKRYYRYFPPDAAYLVESTYAQAFYVEGVRYLDSRGIWHPILMTFDESGSPSDVAYMIPMTDKKRHNGKTPVGFMDGHVEVRSMTAGDLPVRLLNPYLGQN